MLVHDFTWIFVVCIIFAFLDAYGIGANDVANSFSTSVSSKSLTLGQACVIAVFTEFLGAFLMGSGTAETIKGKIISIKNFENQPELLMLAMTCALVGSSTWVLFATRNGWPVSTTHAIVGAIIGVGIAAFGPNSVDWSYNGVAKIITSWFISPVCAGIVASIIYLVTKHGVLKHKNSFERGLIAIPLYFGFTAFINAFYIIYKGSPGLNLASASPGAIWGSTVGITVAVMFFCWFFIRPWLVRKLQKKEDLRWYHVFVVPFLGPRPSVTIHSEEEGKAEKDHLPLTHSWIQHGARQFVDCADRLEDRTASVHHALHHRGHRSSRTVQRNSELTQLENHRMLQRSGQDHHLLVHLPRVRRNSGQYHLPGHQTWSWPHCHPLAVVLHGVRKDVVNCKGERMQKIHDAAIRYDDDTEYMYSFLQVITASMASFAHGSNDVANAVGPLSTVYHVWSTATVDISGKTPVPLWVLAMGGVAIDLGLITYGYNIMRTLGNKITYHSPTRGFSMELGSSLTVLTASKIGLPVSTTHCITGATAAVGLCNGTASSLNWRIIAWCFLSWILTLPFAGLVAGLLFSFAAYAPKLTL
ncbi:phosphate transporter [Basidiobolus meristosporus CBS 931.73]|uniref:Phosphate transporter n=1 Tax=Basidiobolus meristosporus CBS 931.73 TaxID=1314790 RepID=A0A1Y1XUZ4_9FUNG|nr:phosphate transporter [Basidiobolus meristosporus CBS 931.73]|eukprot:ORX89592.1 phosphate transporter [Basidiobolus meristosporus CBS 931.73]